MLAVGSATWLRDDEAVVSVPVASDGSQADSAGSIPVTLSKAKAQVRAVILHLA